MKIAFMLNIFPRLSETFILNQITGLVNKGNNLTIYAERSGDNAEWHSEIKPDNIMRNTYYFMENMPKNVVSRIITGLIFLFIIGLNNSYVFAHYPSIIWIGIKSFSSKMFFRIVYLLQSKHHKAYDIVHAQFGYRGVNTMHLRKCGILQGKFVVSFRGNDISKGLNYYKKAYKKLFQSADLFLPVCEYFRKRLIQLGCDETKIIVHRSGIDCKKFTYYPRNLSHNEAVKLISVGRLVEKKGIIYALKAVNILIDKGYDVRYTVVGDGPQMDFLQKKAANLKIEDNVFFIGTKNHQQTIQILSDSHILLAPSVTASDGDQEGIPNVLKEAMATGMPVISTYHSGIPELVEDGVCGFLAEEKNEHQLAEKIIRLIDNHNMWHLMGSEGRKIIEKEYDIEMLNDQLINIYSQLIDKDNKQRS